MGDLTLDVLAMYFVFFVMFWGVGGATMLVVLLVTLRAARR